MSNKSFIPLQSRFCKQVFHVVRNEAVTNKEIFHGCRHVGIDEIELLTQLCAVFPDNIVDTAGFNFVLPQKSFKGLTASAIFDFARQIKIAIRDYFGKPDIDIKVILEKKKKNKLNQFIWLAIEYKKFYKIKDLTDSAVLRPGQNAMELISALINDKHFIFSFIVGYERRMAVISMPEYLRFSNLITHNNPELNRLITNTVPIGILKTFF
jgi:hypothetical protein